MVPTAAGFWASWLPFALPQCWPFCWWLALVLDHYSRRAVGFAVFSTQPTSEQVRRLLGRLMGAAGVVPRYLVTDSGIQFTCTTFKSWCRRRDIQHRRGAVGKRGSIAVVERFIRTLKDGCTRVLAVVPLGRRRFQREVRFFLAWYNADRPHMTLNGATPDEVYFGRKQAGRQPRFEPRPAWPRAASCAAPQVLVKGQPGVKLEIGVSFLAHRRHLPRVKLTRAA